jgi:hypothetical protein
MYPYNVHRVSVEGTDRHQRFLQEAEQEQFAQLARVNPSQGKPPLPTLLNQVAHLLQLWICWPR